MRKHLLAGKGVSPEQSGISNKKETKKQDGYMEYLQSVSEVTGLLIRRLIDLYHLGYVRNGETGMLSGDKTGNRKGNQHRSSVCPNRLKSYVLFSLP